MPTALVTGTSSGFGLATAERLTDLGWTVLGGMRDPSRAAHDVRWEPVALDLRDPDSIRALARTVAERFGSLDALSNAGYGLLDPLEEVSLTEFRDQLEVNLIGTMTLCVACLPRCARRAASSSRSPAPPGRPPIRFRRVQRVQVRPGGSERGARPGGGAGDRVVIVEPGPFRTEIAAKSPRLAGRGRTGRYDTLWQETDDFLAFLDDGAEDAVIAVDAIVAAATVRGAPLRIPVGKDTGGWIREHAEHVLADVDAAEAFLDAHRGLGIRPGG